MTKYRLALTFHQDISNTCYKKTSGTQWYRKLKDVGFDNGTTFQGMTNITTNGTDHAANANIVLQADNGLMEGESHYVLHPGCLDSCLQVNIPSVYAGHLDHVTCGLVFTDVEELTIWVPEENQLAVGFAHAYAETTRLEGRSFVSDIRVVANDKRLLVDVVNMRSNSYEAAIPPRTEIAPKQQPYTKIEWQPDIAYATSMFRSRQLPKLQLNQLVKLLAHKRPGLKTLDVDAILNAKVFEDNTELKLTVVAQPDHAKERLASIASQIKGTGVVSQDVSNGSSFNATLSEAYDLVVLDGVCSLPQASNRYG